MSFKDKNIGGRFTMRTNYERFVRFLRNVYDKDIDWYIALSEFDRKAIDVDYWNRYGVNPPWMP